MSNTDNDQKCFLLRFEYLFLKEIGYEINLAYSENYAIKKNINYYYKFGQGFLENSNDMNERTLVSGKSIDDLLNYRFNLIGDIDNLRFIDSEKDFSSILKEMRYGKSIWRFLLIIALACLVLESILGIPKRDTLKTDLE